LRNEVTDQIRAKKSVKGDAADPGLLKLPGQVSGSGTLPPSLEETWTARARGARAPAGKIVATGIAWGIITLSEVETDA
jgi:hypothetical protein